MITDVFPTFTMLLGKLKNKISDEDYFELCQINELIVIERDQNGDFEIRSLGGAMHGMRSAALNGEIGLWAEKDGSGICFGALTGFVLPNGAVRAPSFAWIKNDRWDALSKKQKQKFAPLAPDFVVELLAAHESVEVWQIRMREYVENGVQLGWLLDPTTKRVHIYRPDAEPEVWENPTEVSGEPLLKGFVLHLQEIWE